MWEKLVNHVAGKLITSSAGCGYVLIVVTKYLGKIGRVDMHKVEPGTNLIPAQSVEYLVGQYKLAVGRINDAFRLFSEAESGLKAAYGNYSTFCHLSIRESPEGLTRDIVRNFWNYVFTVTKIRDVLTVNRRDQLDRMIERGEMPEITVNNVSDLIASLRDQAPDLMAEFITETFKFLRPSYTGLKTNEAPELGKKVIVEYMVDTSYGLTRLHYSGSSRVKNNNIQQKQ